VRLGYYASRNMSNGIAATITVPVSDSMAGLAVNGRWHVIAGAGRLKNSVPGD
jgi:hypothetical protein